MGERAGHPQWAQRCRVPRAGGVDASPPGLPTSLFDTSTSRKHVDSGFVNTARPKNAEADAAPPRLTWLVHRRSVSAGIIAARSASEAAVVAL